MIATAGGGRIGMPNVLNILHKSEYALTDIEQGSNGRVTSI